MGFQQRAVLILSIAIVASGCASSPVATEGSSGTLMHKNLNSTLWLQTASEYQASSLQSYNAASAYLERAKSDTSWTSMLEQGDAFSSLPAAVVLDVDETVLDNSPYQAQLVLDDTEFDPLTWDDWIARKEASAVPGAVEFLQHLESAGVTAIFITNRECKVRQGAEDACPQKQDTIDNLQSVGIPNVASANLLLKEEKQGWGSEKKSRRAEVAKKYRVIMLFGDDLGDFLPDVKKNITPEERSQLVMKHKSHWGSKWFVFSNPTYGSWLRVLDDPKSKHLEGYP